MRNLNLVGAVVLVIAASTGTTPAAAQQVYWGGDKLWQGAALPNTSGSVFWNSPAHVVAIDPVNNKIFWGDNSPVSAGLPGRIMMGDLGVPGTAVTLLTTVSGVSGPERIDDLEIDVGAQMIYWTDRAKLHVYRSPIANASNQTIQPLPLSAQLLGTLRDIVLDTRPANPGLYWLSSNHIGRSDLGGTNPQLLPFALGGGIFYSFAIDPCTDHFIALGISGGNPYSSIIVRADLANAANATPILQDPAWPPSHIGQVPRTLSLDPGGGMMYWASDLDVNYLPTVRRANLNGTNVQVIVQGTSGVVWSGLALDGTSTTCSTVGINKDLQNDTGQPANDIEILLEGSVPVLNHYDGYPANQFSSFTASPAPGGNTLLTWSAPNNDVQPGQIAHVGFNLPGTSVNILGISWSRDGTTTGCAQQVSTGTHLWGSPGSQVVYTNNTVACAAIPRYVGGLRVEWHARPVPLADLNATTRRDPLRTDVIRGAPIRLAPEATARVNVPTAPPNALFGVIVYKVSTSPNLTGPGVTTDFLQFPVRRTRSRTGREADAPRND